MPILMDESVARARLIDLLAPGIVPVLDTSKREAIKATATLTVVSQPNVGDVLRVGGKVYTFVAGAPGVNEIQTVASLNTTAQNILTSINADTLTTLCLAIRNNAVLTLTANTAGTGGNSIDLESDGVRVTKVAFSGGAAAITEDDISRLLDQNVRASVWAANTAYVAGQVVIPATRNGHRYRVVTAGTSHATTEPTWPDGDMLRVSDGSVTWEEDGIEYDLWDMRNAAYQGWMMKHAKASCMADVRIGDQSKSKSQITKHCMEQAEKYLPVGVA